MVIADVQSDVQVHIVRRGAVVATATLVPVDADTLAVVVGFDDPARIDLYAFVLQRAAHAYAETSRHRALLPDESSVSRPEADGGDDAPPF